MQRKDEITQKNETIKTKSKARMAFLVHSNVNQEY